MKKNFFSARKVTCIDDVWRSLPGWLERKNQRIHHSTLQVTKAVYDSVERAAMRPLLSSVYETCPNTFRTYEIAALPYVLHKSCRYSVPRDHAFKTVRFKVVGGKLLSTTRTPKGVSPLSMMEDPQLLGAPMQFS